MLLLRGVVRYAVTQIRIVSYNPEGFCVPAYTQLTCECSRIDGESLTVDTGETPLRILGVAAFFR
jgi:hypothetical protein